MHMTRLNIYQIARKNANLTQIQASELLHISPRALTDYENGKTVPNDYIVCAMINIYQASWLGYQHLKQNTEVGKRYLPDIDFVDLAKAVLRLQKEVQDVITINTDMVQVAYDGVVHSHEEDTWDHVTREVMEMVGAGLGVIFHQKEKRAHV